MDKLKIHTIIGGIIAIALIAGLIYVVAFRNPATINQIEDREEVGGLYHNNTELGYELQINDSAFINPEIERKGLGTVYYVPTKNSENETYYSTILNIRAIPNSDPAKKENQANKVIGKNNYYTFVSTWLGGCDNEETCALTERIDQSIQSSFKAYNLNKVPTFLTYEDKNAGYGIKYPVELTADYFSEDVADYTSSISLPRDIENKGFGLGHMFGKVLPVEYCDLKGDCFPKTVNYLIGIGEMAMTEQQLLRLPLAQSFTKVRIGDQGFSYNYSEGAEGEGINYYFVPISSGKIIVIAHRYIDEQILINYQKQPNFTKYQKQLEKVIEILESINTFPSLNQTNQ